MNIRRFCCALSGLAALAALGVFAATNAAQNMPAQIATATSGQAADRTLNLPAWAYPVAPPNSGRGAGGARGRGTGQPPADTGPVLHIPGSSQGYTAMQVRNMYAVPDWFPDDHPLAPDIILHGDRANNAGGCGYCHLPNGFGRTENQSIAGLTAGYIIAQVAEFNSGARKTSGPRIAPVATMVHEAQGATDEDVKIAAAYFASIKPKPWIRVVETDTVAVTRVSGVIWVKVDGGGTERLGDDRIVELAEDQERFELRDASSGFVAYVPKGSIARGKKLVMTGGGKTTRCTICHGEDLKGLGNIPYLAGRSPSQLARQIIDIQNGNRNGVDAALMKPVVKNLTNKDIVDITAYLASLTP
jgi:cytochrome c553